MPQAGTLGYYEGNSANHHHYMPATACLCRRWRVATCRLLPTSTPMLPYLPTFPPTTPYLPATGGGRGATVTGGMLVVKPGIPDPARLDFPERGTPTYAWGLGILERQKRVGPPPSPRQ